MRDEDDPLEQDDPLMAMLGAASIRSRIATGAEAGEPWRRLGDRVESVEEDEAGVELRAAVPPRCVRQGGMSLHADVRSRREIDNDSNGSVVMSRGRHLPWAVSKRWQTVGSPIDSRPRGATGRRMS